MAKVWVQAKTILRVPDENGQLRTYHPGDWCAVGKHKAREWLANKQAIVPDDEKRRKIVYGELGDCGVIVRGDAAPLDAVLDPQHGIKIAHTARNAGTNIRISWSRVLIWDTSLELSSRQLLQGFVRIEVPEGYNAWEMAVMLYDNRELASKFGTEAEKQKTLKVVGDLRLPVYDTRALWVRKTKDAERVIDIWRAELDDGADLTHAFLRTIFTNPIRLCTLPKGWLSKWRPV